MKKNIILLTLALMATSALAIERQKLNFNGGWLLEIGDFKEASLPAFDDSAWKQVTLPRAFNGDEAFRKDIVDLTDTIVWYRKHFSIPAVGTQRYFLGFDLTPYIKEGENVLAVRCDNSWQYRSRVHDSRYQWNDRNFNANYGGIPKNVYLHITDKVYQTLPLYSNLGTTGTYVYATDFDIAAHKATIHVESQVRNEDSKAHTFFLTVVVKDNDGNKIAGFNGDKMITLQPGETILATAEKEMQGLHFWSWGYGYLYTVETYLREKLETASADNDKVVTRTGFRKTEFGNGLFRLNDRVLMVHGYAQRTSNEWPGTGLSVPAWLSDYSNALMVESGGNLVRWMHVTPWKQDIESCDRVGLIQAMPAGDAEKDVDGPRWTQRTELMRDAIIYNRNNPTKLSTAVRCSTSTSRANIPCGQWSTVVTKVCASTGTNTPILTTRKATVRSTAMHLPSTTTTTWMPSPARWWSAGTNIGWSVPAQESASAAEA